MSANELLPNTVADVEPLPPPLQDAPEPPGVLAAPATPGLSLRSNFAWSLSGNVVYAACQWGMIIALAKLGNSFMVGQFALGLAIATPVLTFANLNLRAVQATDARRLHSFTEYWRLRVVTTLAAMTVIAGIVWFGHYERSTAAVILAVAAAKGIETLSDIYYGLFQLNDRLDQTGRSMMLRGTLSVVALGTGLYVTRDVVWACAWLTVAWLATLVLFDIRSGHRFATRYAGGGRHTLGRAPQPENRAHRFRRQWELMRLALPLGMATTISSINLNIPRYFIHARLGEHQLGIFSAMAYATVAMTLISDSLAHCAVPRMSRLYSGGRLAEFRWLLARLLAAGAALGLCGLALARAMGARLLATFYSPEYSARSGVFFMLVLAAAIHCMAAMLTTGISSARCFRIQVPLYALVAGTTALACAWLVPAAGLEGGAVAMVIGAGVRATLAGAVVGYVLWTSRHCATEQSLQPLTCDRGPRA